MPYTLGHDTGATRVCFNNTCILIWLWLIDVSTDGNSNCRILLNTCSVSNKKNRQDCFPNFWSLCLGSGELGHLCADKEADRQSKLIFEIIQF